MENTETSQSITLFEMLFIMNIFIFSGGVFVDIKTRVSLLFAILISMTFIPISFFALSMFRYLLKSIDRYFIRCRKSTGCLQYF